MIAIHTARSLRLLGFALFISSVSLLSNTPAAAQAGRRGCLSSGNGYVRAKVQGALELNIDWRDAELQCDGSPRPDGTGVRVSFAGPGSDGHRLRLVFGIAKAAEGGDGRELPTNLTVIVEGEKRVFATRGEDKCTTDSLRQERIGALGGHSRSYRVIARGFCTGPASSLNGKSRIVLTSFDFAGGVSFDDSILDLAKFPKTKVRVKSARGEQQFDSWIARSPQEQEQGLMFVNDLPADKAMLFLEQPARVMHMWMKNTFVELDMLFVGPGGKIVYIVEHAVPHSLDTIGPDVPVAAVVEIKGGEVERRGLKQGDAVSWTRP